MIKVYSIKMSTGVVSLCMLTACALSESPSKQSRMASPVSTLTTVETPGKMAEDIFPEYWMKFVTENNLLGKSLVKEEIYSDGSSDEYYIDIFDQARSINEATGKYPGMAVVKDGYVPVASPRRSADPYFINLDEGEGGTLYLIDHVSLEKEVVMKNYQMLLDLPVQDEK